MVCVVWKKEGGAAGAISHLKSILKAPCVCTEVQVVSLHGGELSDRVTVRLWLVRPGVHTPEESRGGECLTFVLCTDKRSVPRHTSEDRIKS